MISRDVLFTGLQVAYYVICPTKLWLFTHFLTRENESELVSLGSFLEENTYTRAEKDILIDQKISIDFIRSRGKLIINEIKKSPKLEKAHKYQMLYYLYYLKKFKNIEASGVITYPAKRKIVKVELTESKEREIETILREIKEIIFQKIPPKPTYKKYCRKCAYFEFCFGD